jgi:hypothetical protein
MGTTWDPNYLYKKGDLIFLGDNGTQGANSYYYALDSSLGIPPQGNTNFWKFIVPSTQTVATTVGDSRIYDYRYDYSPGDTVALGSDIGNIGGGSITSPRDGKVYICLQQTGQNDAAKSVRRGDGTVGSNGPSYWAVLFTPDTVSF